MFGTCRGKDEKLKRSLREGNIYQHKISNTSRHLSKTDTFFGPVNVRFKKYDSSANSPKSDLTGSETVETSQSNNLSSVK